jgi:type II secretory pathway predicted ATPase ExeA
MIRSYFGLTRSPFCGDEPTLLAQQQAILDTLRVHCQQGGLCLVLGEPGTGKSVIKDALRAADPRRLIVPVVSRTLHSYFNTLRILCQAFGIGHEGAIYKCEKRLIEEAHKLNREGKMIAPVIDDAHLMDVDCLRKLRLLMEDFPKNHNLTLIAQDRLLQKISLSVNHDIKSRITYSVLVTRLAPDDMSRFILDQLEQAGLGHNTFTEEALDLVVRSGDGYLRRVRNLCLSCLIETVRDQTKTVDLKQVNRVLIQPHWRKPYDLAETGL